MPVIRGHHSFDDHFTQIPNAWVRDERLSFKARGLLVLILSHTAGWSLSINTLAKQNQEGKDAIRAAIQELETLGYLTRTQVNEGGRFGESIWTTNDPSDLPSSENPTSENPTTKKNIIKEEQVKEKKRASKIDPNFQVSHEMVDWFVSSGLRVDPNKETASFIDYYIANGVVRVDWVASWRNWMRNAEKYSKSPIEKAKESQAQESRLKMQTEKEWTKKFIEESQKAAQAATPAPKCKHGKTIAMCAPCASALS